MGRASSELAVRKTRTNPLFPQEEKLMWRQDAGRGGRQRLQASTRALLLFKVLFTAVATVLIRYLCRYSHALQGNEETF